MKQTKIVKKKARAVRPLVSLGYTALTRLFHALPVGVQETLNGITMFEQEDFPYCCAFTIISNFPGDDELSESTDYLGDEKTIHLPYRAVAVSLARDLAECRCDRLVATTATDDSGEIIERLLPYVGFKAISTKRNPRSGNMVTLWLLEK